MIQQRVLQHAGDYQYRLHTKKIEKICPEQLKKFFESAMIKIPDEYFLDGPRCSAANSIKEITIKKIEHEVSVLTRIALESNYYDNAHLNVQMFMLGYDHKTVGIEVPVWLEEDEQKQLDEGFIINQTKILDAQQNEVTKYSQIKKEKIKTPINKIKQNLTGHIDLIRIENGKIWVWDYKPNAHREKKAHIQTTLYTLMLSKRTGIPLKQLRCGYFDDKNVYEVNLENIKSN